MRAIRDPSGRYYSNTSRLNAKKHARLSGKRKGNGLLFESQAILTPEVVFGSSPEARSTSSSVLTAQRDEEGRLLTDKLPLPVINDLDTLSPSFRRHWEQLAEAPRKKKRLTREVMRATIEKVCQGHYLTLHALANVLQRDKTALRNEYLTPMVSSGILRLAFSDTPTHQKQAYTANTKEGTSPHAP